MIKADMHIHSTVSDGSFTIPELISRAKGKRSGCNSDHRP